jgi:hypothetical protein
MNQVNMWIIIPRERDFQIFIQIQNLSFCVEPKAIIPLHSFHHCCLQRTKRIQSKLTNYDLIDSF